MKNRSAVLSMALCVFLLITAEFMPVSLLTPIAHSLQATDGMVGQAIAVSGFFAVAASLLVGPLAGPLDRRVVLLGLTACLGFSLLLIARAQNFALLMLARALLGLVIGAFWALSTAIIMRLVPKALVPKALGLVYMGNAIAVAFAPPAGSWLGTIVGWRWVFLALLPVVLVSFIWQRVALPSLPPQAALPLRRVFSLLRRAQVRRGLAAMMFAFMGAFMIFTYFRPFLETVTHVSAAQLSLAFLALGIAAFGGTAAASKLANTHLYALLRGLSFSLAAVSLALIPTGPYLLPVFGLLVLWGGLNAAIPVGWSSWLAHDVADEPEAAGALMVAAIQLSIMLGANLGGLILDRFSLDATITTGAIFLGISGLLVRGAPSKDSRA